MIVPGLHEFSTMFIERLLNTAAEGIVLAGLVWIILRLVRRVTSGTRFAIWFSALLAIVALPFFAGFSFVQSSVQGSSSSILHRPVVISSRWALLLFVAWSLAAGFFILRLGVGLWQLHRCRKACSEVDLAGLDPAVAGIVREFGGRRRVKLLASESAAVPAAVGFFRPAILFPAWLLPELSADEIKLILLHELAHLRRWDDWTNLAQKIVKALFFFHPAVWWIERSLTLEREMACDDMVLTQSTSARAYASSLISFAEKLQGGRALALAQSLLGRMRQMSPRLAQILDEKRTRHSGICRSALGLSAALVLLVVAAAPYAPRLVAFEAKPAAVSGHRVASQALNTTGRSTASIRESAVPQSAPQVRIVRAASLQSRRAMRPLRLTTKPKPQVRTLQAAVIEPSPAIQETIVIVRETRFDTAGSANWTLCIWEVRGNGQAWQRWDSTIFVGSI